MDTNALLFEIYIAKKRMDVVPAYRRGIVANPNGTRENKPAIAWAQVNQAIITRWSPAALAWIKLQAWKQR